MPYAVYDCGCGHSHEDHELLFEPMAGKFKLRLCCLIDGCKCGPLLRGPNVDSLRAFWREVWKY